MLPSSSHSRCWQELRRRQRLGITSFLLFFLIALCSGFLSEYLHRAWIFIVGGALGFAIMFASGIYYQTFPCPRCNHWFFVALWPRFSWHWLAGRACAHCGLRVFSDPSEKT